LDFQPSSMIIKQEFLKFGFQYPFLNKSAGTCISFEKANRFRRF